MKELDIKTLLKLVTDQPTAQPTDRLTAFSSADIAAKNSQAGTNQFEDDNSLYI